MGDLIKGKPEIDHGYDHRREKAIFAPLVVMTILLGVYPALILDIIGPSVAALVDPTTTRHWPRLRPRPVCRELLGRAFMSYHDLEDVYMADLTIILPEILLSVYAMGALIGAVYTGKDGLASRCCLGHRRCVCGRCSLDRGLRARELARTSPLAACSLMTASRALPR